MIIMSTDLTSLISALKAIAPTQLAADWDNVGLLIEGTPNRKIETVFFCIDLTHAVLDEAIGAKADVIVAYHPPIFGGLKRLTRRSPGQHLMIRIIEAGISVWSPHTALDAAKDGLCDWLLDGAGEMKEREIIEACPAAVENLEVGMGRTGRLKEPVTLPEMVKRIKAFLGLENLRLASATRHAEGKAIKRVSVCPGAGGSLFTKVRFTDLLITGEMRHHDVLGKLAAGTSVILTDHTNTERGYLPILAARVSEATGVKTHVSALDADPLVIV
jgi:dinuclear metal center YbgI/SA1388 family protein